jgi:leucyl-tRNA synthetase
MNYRFRETEQKWQERWREDKTYKVTEDSTKEKFYVLDMFPYPSGAGLHVGHPLGYIASDVYTRYKRLLGYNVLHPMGYDSFGLPAEQYAIQTGQHPAITTKDNIKRYRDQLDRIGFSFDWDREVRTSNPDYYKWTQWIFKQLFNSWYNNDTDKAISIDDLIAKLGAEGNANVNGVCDEDTPTISAADWNEMSEADQQKFLLKYRLTYLSDAWVNWCPELGTVLANDEVKDGVSERGGFPVERKLMRQWSMRITAYAQRLLDGLDDLDWTDALKEQQRNWIGRSEGASVKFQLDGHDEMIEVFTTRPDTIFGVTFMVLAPEHDLVDQITTAEHKEAIAQYVEMAKNRSERDRMSDVKTVTGEFTGAHVIHPFSGEKIPVWIGDYVLAGYGTGAVMAVPGGDDRDWNFAKHFQLSIIATCEGTDLEEGANASKEAVVINSDFLNGMTGFEAMKVAIEAIEEKGIGKGKINFRLRDAIFSRQRYWGEPIPVYYKDDVPYVMEDDQLPLQLPEVDKYLPTEEGEPPLARAENWVTNEGHRIEYNTMPGWAGSSWYYYRYMDTNNESTFASKEKLDYWGNVDLYIGGAEHAVGHLLYARFWNKFLKDLELVPFEEPFKKLINQGMIGGAIEYMYLMREKKDGYPHFICSKLVEMKDIKDYVRIPVRIDIVEDYGTPNSYLSTNGLAAFSKWIPEYENAIFECSKGLFHKGEFTANEGAEGSHLITHTENGKMGKRYHNTVDPEAICDEFGADTLRLYEMFLGPLEDHKPWNTKGISGVSGFIKKVWRLFYSQDGLNISDEPATKEELKALHKAIKKVREELDRYSFNTVVSTYMICVNELGELKCNKRAILEPLTIMLSPYAPHLAEELWEVLGHTTSVTKASFPEFDGQYLVESSFSYPVSFNGKMRFKIELPADMPKEEVEERVLSAAEAQKYLGGKTPKKVIVVPKRIVNVVI